MRFSALKIALSKRINVNIDWDSKEKCLLCMQFLGPRVACEIITIIKRIKVNK